VITRGRSDEEGPDAAALEADHQQDQAAMSGLSRRGRQVIARESGHHIPIEAPEVVAAVIKELLAAARR
jgi:pimeloyl-ACP methyl ester carboxylesterase